MTNDCSYFTSLITGLIDDELNAADKNEVKLHLDNCPDCYKLYLDEGNIKKIIKKGIPIVKAPVHLKRRIRRQLIRKGDKPGFWQLVKSLFVYQPVPASFAFVIMICLLFLPIFQMLGNPGHDSISNLSGSENINKETVLNGAIICLDCEYLSQNPEIALHPLEFHRSGIKTNDDNIWTFVNSEEYQTIAHNKELTSKKVEVTGIIFERARYIYVNNYKLL